jgi:hypothetical protein
MRNLSRADGNGLYSAIDNEAQFTIDGLQRWRQRLRGSE